MNRHLAPLLLAAAALTAPAWSRHVRPDRYEGGRRQDEAARIERNTSGAAMLLGQLRSSLNDVLFLKTENYLHSGVLYLPHLGDQKVRSNTEAGADAAAHEREVPRLHRDERGNEVMETDHGHQGMMPVIRTRALDFRGWIGDLHRAVKPWRDPSLPHLHTSGTELLPWFRVMTLHDPHYVRAYSTGTYWLMQKDPRQAVEFAREGARNNPDSFQAGLTLAEALYHEARTRPGADLLHPSPALREELSRVRDAYRAAAEAALRERPPHPETLPEDHPWRLWMDTDAMRAVQMAALLEKQVGDPAEAARLAARGLRFYPQNSSLRRIAGAPPAPRNLP